MRNITKIVLAFIILIIIGCKEKKASYFISPLQNIKNIQFDKIIMDSIQFEKIESSFVGSVKVYSGKIYFIDKKFGWIFEFDKEGTLIKRHLGVGRGPSELNTKTIEGYDRLRDGRHIFIGPGNDCHIYKENFTKEKFFIMDKRYKRSKMNKSEYKPDMPEIYTLAYEKFIVRNYNNYIYFTIISEHPVFNFIKNPKEYFDDCRIIAKVNLSNGKVEDLLGRYSPVYKENDNFKQISLTNFDIADNGDFYVSQEADSLIYVYSNDFKIKESFGFKGKNMDLPKRKLSTIEEFRRYCVEEREQKGYYDWIEYIDETGLLFRSYKKGINSPSDGLQIYKNDILIADIDVPKNFKITGYIAPYYYSNEYIDEGREKMVLYKFKLK